MMAYLIDGHNLIGQLPDISLSDPNDEAKLVLKLKGFAARTRKRVIVVFDNGVPAGKSHLGNSVVEVLFASPGTTADAIMQARIRTAPDPMMWVVVSGDNEVLAAARERKMRAIKSAEFVPELNPPKPPPKHLDKEAHMDVPVTPQEVEEWLRIFGKKPPKKK